MQRASTSVSRVGRSHLSARLAELNREREPRGHRTARNRKLRGTLRYDTRRR
jgi:hypothetical protein